jgi:mRNA interferase MazF
VALPGGLAVSGVVLSYQARSVDWRGRNAAYVCDLPGKVLALVVQNIKDLIDG